MRQLSVILVIVIGLLTLTPAPEKYTVAGHATVSIRAFDICHDQATAIHVDLPDFIQERSGNPGPLMIIDVRNAPDALFHPLLVPYQDDHPPRA